MTVAGIPRRPRPDRRGATLYVTVLMTTMIVVLSGLAGMTLSRVEVRRSEMLHGRILAQANAHSAIEFAINATQQDSSWRTNYFSGQESPTWPIGTDQGTISWILEDSDGDLTNDDIELWLRGIGRVGREVQVLGVQVESPVTVLDALSTTVYSAQDMSASGSVIAHGGPLVSAQALDNEGVLTGDVECLSLENEGTISGAVTENVFPRRLPSADVFDTYRDLATEIDFGDIPAGDIKKELLAGFSNPFGSSNSRATYHIEVPAGDRLRIEESRIVGCLLITLGNNATFQLRKENLWEPPLMSNHPALIVRALGEATVELRGSTHTLDEGSTRNMNPLGVPYEGAWDFDDSDEYVCRCKGLFHVIGADATVSLSSDLNLEGTVLADGDVDLDGVQLTMDPAIFSNPPDGYTMEQMRVVAGTWRREQAP